MKYMLIDVTTVEGTRVMTVAHLRTVQLLGQLAQAEGRKVIAPPVEGRGLAKIERFPLQYLFWNLTQRTPPDDYGELCKQTLVAIDALPLDATSIEDLERRVAAIAPPQQESAKQENGESKPARQVSERPKGTSVTGRVWEIADECLAKTGLTAAQVSDWKPIRAAIMTACEAEGIHSATGATQYSKWKGAKLKG